MSVDQFFQLMAQDPELRQRLIDAASNEERAAMLAEQGIELPTNAQVEARIAELKEMADVDGGRGEFWNYFGGAWAVAGLFKN